MEDAQRPRPHGQRDLISDALSDLPAVSMTGGDARSHRRRAHAYRREPLRLLMILIGAGLIIAGVVVIAIPLWRVHQRGEADSQALNDWNHGGAQAIVGSVGAGHSGLCTASAAPPDDYALVAFPGLGDYNYAGVSGDGTWDLLHSRSMVHYQGSAAPGAQGNDIIAFHREPNFQHIDELKEGGIVTVQDRSCHVFRYRVTQRWEGSPDAVTQLAPTDGHDLTLVTCTPWYIDTQRIVWRASLVEGPSPSPSAANKS